MGKRGPQKVITKGSQAITIHVNDQDLIEIEKVRHLTQLTRPAIIRIAIREYLDRFWRTAETDTQDPAGDA